MSVDGVPAVKPSTKVRDDQSIEVAGADHYVSRGAHKLIAALDADDFEVRQKAVRELEDLGEGVADVLRRTKEHGASVEAARRAAELLAKLEAAEVTPQQLRELRAVRILEISGTPEARQVLRRLADGAPEARLSVAAKAALQRLEWRTEGPP